MVTWSVAPNCARRTAAAQRPAQRRARRQLRQLRRRRRFALPTFWDAVRTVSLRAGSTMPARRCAGSAEAGRPLDAASAGRPATVMQGLERASMAVRFLIE